MSNGNKVINIFYEKLTESRDLARLTQGEIAKFTRLSQPRISRIERGEGKFVPNSYLILLWSKGINLNDLFDDKISLDEFRHRFNTRFQKSECKECQDKDERIRELKGSNKMLLEMIDLLKKRSGCDEPTPEMHTGKPRRR